MRTIKRYFAVYVPLLISFVTWITFYICYSRVYYNGYEAGFDEAMKQTLNMVNKLSIEDGIKYELRNKTTER